MNRKTRRAERKSHKISGNVVLADNWACALSVADMLSQASGYHQQGRSAQAEIICNNILTREPSHVHALNFLGLILQESGRHKLAVKMLAKAIAADPWNAACHYNIAASYQALDLQDEAALHFKKAIAFGVRQNNTEKLVLQNPVIATCIGRIEDRWPLPVPVDELFARSTLAAIANDLFLRCALETVLLRGIPLERSLRRSGRH